MSHEPTLTLELQDLPVTLHHPGAEGVRFHDAVFVIRNEGSAPAEHIRLGDKCQDIVDRNICHEIVDKLRQLCG